MSFPTSPAMTVKEDSKYYSVVQSDNAYNTRFGGITYHWVRTAIQPKRIFTTGFTFITTAEKDKFFTFWQSKGMFDAFDWTNPETSKVIKVRFVQAPEFKYEGRGSNARWSFRVSVREV